MSYYQKYFPAEEVFGFATLHHVGFEDRREFVCVTSQNVWRRYQSADTPEDLRKLAVKAGTNGSVHLGPYFEQAAPRARGKGIVGKQLPFDLDLTDISFLGIKKTDQTSNDRWVRLVFGHVEILRAVLHEIFGFVHFLPVYSGGRGAHLWVLDKRANDLSDDARRGICGMLKPRTRKHDKRLFVATDILDHPSFDGTEVKSAMHDVLVNVLLAPVFKGGVGMLEGAIDVVLFIDRLFFRFDDDPVARKFHNVEQACEARIRDEMRQSNAFNHDAFVKLKSILHLGAEQQTAKKKPTAEAIVFRNLVRTLDDVIFTLCWPTLDAGPTASMNHVLKLPFSQHATTQRIAVPVTKLIPQNGTALNLPPIVTVADLGLDGSLGRSLFDVGVSCLKKAVEASIPKDVHTSMDIEDMAGPAARPHKATKFE